MKIKFLLPILLASALLSFAGCGEAETTPEVQETKPDTVPFSITVDVIGKTPVSFTEEDAAAIGPVEITAAKKDGDTIGEPDTYTGILFNDFLEHIGVTSYSVISIEAADGYMKEFGPDDITADGTGLAWLMNGDVFEGENGPVQLVNHERGPKWWIKNVTRITIIE